MDCIAEYKRERDRKAIAEEKAFNKRQSENEEKLEKEQYEIYLQLKEIYEK